MQQMMVRYKDQLADMQADMNGEPREVSAKEAKKAAKAKGLGKKGKKAAAKKE